MDEKEYVRQYCNDFSPFMYDLVPQCVADTEIALRGFSVLNARQKRNKRAQIINMSIANEWEKRGPYKGWQIENSDYTHLIHDTGIRITLRSIDRSTGKPPYAGHTRIARARYRQNGCLTAQEIHYDLLGKPDLRGIEIMLVCDYDALNSTFLQAYKPINEGTYQDGLQYWYEFPIDRPDSENTGLGNTGFTPAPEEDLNLLDQLVDDNEELPLSQQHDTK
jgi:hypothetical protein